MSLQPYEKKNQIIILQAKKKKNTYGICGTNVFGIESACIITSLIWIACFGINTTIFFDVLEGIVH